MNDGRSVPTWCAIVWRIRVERANIFCVAYSTFQLRKSWRYVVEMPYVPISEVMSTAALASAAAAVPSRDVVFHFSGHFDLVIQYYCTGR